MDNEAKSKKMTGSGSVSSNFLKLFQEVIPLFRIILSNLIVALSFILAGELIFWVIAITATDIRTRIEFIGWLLDGAQVTSFIATISIFVISIIADFVIQIRLVRFKKEDESSDST